MPSTRKWSADWVAAAFVLLLIALALVYWALTLRSGRLRASARMLPPDSVQPGDVPYLLCRGRMNFNMLVCHWASLGYLSMFVNEKGNVILRRRIDMGNERRKMECRLFEALFAGNDLCDGASLRYKRTAAKAIEQTPRYWARRLYDRSSGNIYVMQGLCAIATGIAMLLSMSVILPVMGARGFVLFLFLLLGIPMSLLVQRAVRAVYLRQYLWLALGGVSALAMLILSGPGDALTMLASLAASVFTGWQTMHGSSARPQASGSIFSASPAAISRRSSAATRSISTKCCPTPRRSASGRSLRGSSPTPGLRHATGTTRQRSFRIRRPASTAAGRKPWPCSIHPSENDTKERVRPLPDAL